MAIGFTEALPTKIKGIVPKAMWDCASLAYEGSILHFIYTYLHWSVFANVLWAHI